MNHAILMSKKDKKEKKEKLLNVNAIFLLRIISILGLNGNVNARISLRWIVYTRLFAEISILGINATIEGNSTRKRKVKLAESYFFIFFYDLERVKKILTWVRVENKEHACEYKINALICK